MQTVTFLKKYKPRYALISKYYDSPQAASAKFEGKVDQGIMDRRMKVIEGEMQQAGVICNLDGSDFMQERFQRVNKR